MTNFSYPVYRGGVSQELSWVRTMRGRTQLDITVHHKRIEATYFGDQYLPLVKTYRENMLHEPTGSKALFGFICNYCSPVLERLAPQTYCQGFTLEDLLRSPTYTLEIVGTGTSRETCIIGGDKFSYTPAFNMCPLKTAELPAGYKAIDRLYAEQILVNVDNHDQLGSAQGRVITQDGRSMYLKPRELAREKHFDRELCILNDIKQNSLIEKLIKLPDLQGIVISNEIEEECVGVLINLIPTSSLGVDLLSSWCRTQYKLHKQWEQQVTATVEKLHVHGIVWGDVNAGNVVIDDALDAWVIDFGGTNNPVFVDNDKAETIEGDWQGIRRLFREWLLYRPKTPRV